MSSSSSSRSSQIAALLLLAAAPAGFAAEVVARVGTAEITSDELRAHLAALSPNDRAALAADRSLLAQEVRVYLARRAVLSVARAKKWDQEPAVKAQLERVRQEALGELYLQHVSSPPANYPGEAEVEAVYQAGKAFETPRQYRLAQIFVAAKAPASKGVSDAPGRADALAKRLQAPQADFAAVARTESEEKSGAERDGEIGWLSEEQMVPGIRAPVAALAKDQVSAPIRLDDGWHFLKLLDVRPAGKKPLKEVREAIVAQLRAERSRANRQAYLAKLLEEDPPAINELLLSKVLEPAQ